METNFYRQSAINQNLTFDRTYSSRLEMEIAQNKINGRVVDDGIFPKRLVIINYSLRPSNWDDEKMPSWGYPNNEKGYFKYNANRDNSYYQNNYDSTVWQKVRGPLKSFSWSDEKWSSTDIEGWIYQQIAELDSITIEVNTLDLSENQASILVGANSEGVGVPVYAGSFLDVQEGSDDNGTFYTLTHESNFTSYDIPTLNKNELKFRDFKVDLAHVTNSKNLILKASGDIVLNSENYNDEIESEFIISHKVSDVGNSYNSNTSFDASNKTIYIDKPGFDEHGHLNKTGSKDFSFSIIGDEDIILSNYADNEITLSHKEAAFSTTAIAPTWEEKSLYIPQLTFDKWGHINLNTNNFLQIKFQSDDTYITNENLTYGIKFNHKTYSAGEKSASITPDVSNGAIDLLIPKVSRDSGGHVNSLDGFSYNIGVDNTILLLSDTTDNSVTIKHKDNYAVYTFETDYQYSKIEKETNEDNDDEFEDVLALPIPRFSVDKYGHVNKKDTGVSYPYIYSDGVIYFNDNTPSNEGRICHRNHLTLTDDSELVKNSDYKLYDFISDVYLAFGDRSRFKIKTPIFDNQGHIIKDNSTSKDCIKYYDFVADNNIDISIEKQTSQDGVQSIASIFNHKVYNNSIQEEILPIKTISPIDYGTMENIQSYEQYYDSSLSTDKVYKFKFYKKIVWNISMLSGSRYYCKIYYLNDVSKTDLSEAAIIESTTTGTPPFQTQNITGTFEEKLYPEQELVLEIGPQADVFFYPTTAVQGYTNNNFTQLSISNFLFNNAGHYRDKNYYEDIDLTEEIKLEYETEVQEIIDTEVLNTQIYHKILSKVTYPIFYIDEETGAYIHIAKDSRFSNIPEMLQNRLTEQLKINWLEGQYKIRKSNENTILILNPNNFQINQEEDSNHIAINLSNSLLNRIDQLEARIAELENK